MQHPGLQLPPDLFLPHSLVKARNLACTLTFTSSSTRER
jgi:hypothetical protein